ncbi:hypothetical protein QCA50_011576 [Cerrena zonata]|uniref:S-adenosyl-L-methionine-dependent methyltransferase n=1 Tax=Cerrena zonata TaxID=2478898 RepID=A0AAW0FVV5_9APHY
MDDMFAELDTLVSLIASSVDKLKQEFKESGKPVPSIHSTESHPFDTGPISQRFDDALRTVQGACAQLTTLVSPPQLTVANLGFSQYTTACIGVVLKAKVADHLQSKSEGMPISRLAEVTKVDVNKLARVLRLLATKQCFREVSPDIFANNRLSILLVDGSPFSALTKLMSDENYHAGCALADTLLDPVATSSSSPKDSPFSRALRYDGSLWDWYKDVDPEKGERFGQAMIGFSAILKYDSILNGFPWKDQPQGTTVCDVGGGVGHISMHFAKACPQLHLTVQDRPETVEQALQLWNNAEPEIMKEGRVNFVPINFLEESPVKGCDYYFLKSVIHDWADPDCRRILTNVKKVMKPTARLIIHECLIQHVSKDDSEESHFVSTAPKPLLPNYGEGRIFEYLMDICMLGLVNAKERTLREFIALGKDCGLELVKVWDCGLQNSLEFKLANVWVK